MPLLPAKYFEPPEKNRIDHRSRTNNNDFRELLCTEDNKKNAKENIRPACKAPGNNLYSNRGFFAPGNGGTTRMN